MLAQLFSRSIPFHLGGYILVVHEALDVKRNGGAVGRHLLLELLALVQKALPGARVALRIKTVTLLELLSELLPDDFVEEETADGEIVSSAEHLHLALVERHQRSLDGRVTDVHESDDPRRVLLRRQLAALVHAVRKTHGGVFVHDPQHVKARDLARRQQRATLVVSKVKRNLQYQRYVPI